MVVNADVYFTAKMVNTLYVGDGIIAECASLRSELLKLLTFGVCNYTKYYVV